VQLGTVFLEEYSVGLDIEKGKIGFSGYVEHLPPEGNPPEDSNLPLWALILLILIVGSALIVAITLCFLKRKKVIVEKNVLLVNQTKQESIYITRESCINKD